MIYLVCLVGAAGFAAGLLVALALGAAASRGDAELRAALSELDGYEIHVVGEKREGA